MRRKREKQETKRNKDILGEKINDILQGQTLLPISHLLSYTCAEKMFQLGSRHHI